MCIIEIKLLLVAQEGPAREEYSQSLAGFDVEVDAVSTLSELHGALLEAAYSGLLLDVAVMSRATRSDKALVGDLLDLFPMLRLSWDSQSGKIHSLFFGQTGGDPIELATFIDEHCRSFQARCIRRNVRRAVHLNVHLSRGEDFAPTTLERTNTLDISVGGCFLYSNTDWRDTKTAWLRINELRDDSTIPARLRWFTPWGTPRRLPGIGLEFLRLTESQMTEIGQLLFPR